MGLAERYAREEGMGEIVLHAYAISQRTRCIKLTRDFRVGYHIVFSGQQVVGETSIPMAIIECEICCDGGQWVGHGT